MPCALLRDQDLIVEHAGAANTVRYTQDIAQGRTIDDSGRSMLQACSVDLHIGDIYLPGTKADEPGSVGHPKVEHTLMTGETAMVQTQETVHLPSDVAAIGFPPSKDVSSRGLLMTNPGHVDPGYEGHLKFTVINMGKEPFDLNQTAAIVTLLLFRLDGAVRADWQTRHGNQPPGDLQQAVNRLSPDFVEVTKRAQGIVDRAELAVKQAQVTSGFQGTIIAAAIALLGVLVAPSLTARYSKSSAIDGLDNRVKAIESRDSADAKIQSLDTRVKALEAALAKSDHKPDNKTNHSGTQ